MLLPGYRTASGKCPVKEHLDSLTDIEATKRSMGIEIDPRVDHTNQLLPKEEPENSFKGD